MVETPLLHLTFSFSEEKTYIYRISNYMQSIRSIKQGYSKIPVLEK